MKILSGLKKINPWWSTGTIVLMEEQKDSTEYLIFEKFFNQLNELTVASPNRALIAVGTEIFYGKALMDMAQRAIERLIGSGTPPKNILFVPLSAQIYRNLYLEEIVILFREEFAHGRYNNLFIFFTEIEKFPNWQQHIKSLVDSYPDYQFVVIGDESALTQPSRESGAGRFREFICRE